MSSTKEQRVSSLLTSELAVDEREREREREGFNAGGRGRGHIVTLLSVPLGLLSYCASFMSKYQVLCYCSLAKPDPHTKS